MKLLIKKNVVVLLCLFVFSVVSTQFYAQTYGIETVVGSVSGTQDAGEAFHLYKSSADSFREYLAGWRDMGWKDRRVNYSEAQLHEKCLDEAKRQYGRNYSNLSLRNFYFMVEEKEMPDEESYSNVVGSSAQYRKTDRVKRIYKYSATVVAIQ